MKAAHKDAQRIHRHHRVRARVKGTAERPRLVISRTLKHIAAQIIDDTVGRTLAAALDTEIKEKKSGKERAAAVGALLAEKAKKAGITQVVFDRGGHKYHGRVAALADAARSGGLQF
ncbi:MAG: 50S ribosomal protein L18 [Patescibacteria group bacterium]|jgi:large subunit ribosomal protein L18